MAYFAGDDSLSSSRTGSARSSTPKSSPPSSPPRSRSPSPSRSSVSSSRSPSRRSASSGSPSSSPRRSSPAASDRSGSLPALPRRPDEGSAISGSARSGSPPRSGSGTPRSESVFLEEDDAPVDLDQLPEDMIGAKLDARLVSLCRHLKLERLLPSFVLSDLNYDVLLEMPDEQLAALIPAAGPRLRLADHLAKERLKCSDTTEGQIALHTDKLVKSSQYSVVVRSLAALSRIARASSSDRELLRNYRVVQVVIALLLSYQEEKHDDVLAMAVTFLHRMSKDALSRREMRAGGALRAISYLLRAEMAKPPQLIEQCFQFLVRLSRGSPTAEQEIRESLAIEMVLKQLSTAAAAAADQPRPSGADRAAIAAAAGGGPDADGDGAAAAASSAPVTAMHLLAIMCEGSSVLQEKAAPSMPLIVSYLSNEDPQMRAEAIRALGAVGASRALSKLSTAAEKQLPPWPRAITWDKHGRPIERPVSEGGAVRKRSAAAAAAANREAFASKGGAITAVMENLQHDNEAVVAAALGTIARLALSDAKLQGKFLDQQPFKVIVDLLMRDNEEIQLGAAQAIYGLLARAGKPSDDHQTYFRRTGAIYRLVAVTNNTFDRDLQAAVFRALYVLALDNEINQDLVFGALGSQPLKDAISSRNTALMLHGCQLLALLSAQKYRREELLELGCLDVLRTLCKSAQQQAVREVAASAVLNLSKA